MIQSKEELEELLSKAAKKERVNYEFLCKGCGEETSNSNTCGALRARFERIGFERFMLCKSCATKLGKSKRSPEEIRAANEKRKKTCLAKYGVENLFKDVQRIEAARFDKYQVKNISQSEDIKAKKKQAYLKHFGVENPSQSPQVLEKRKNTLMQRYGAESSFSSPIIQDKIKQTNRAKYGKDYHTQTNEFREHLKEIWKDKKKELALSKKVSDTWARKTEEELRLIRSKAHKAYLYQNEWFDSSWELAVYIYAKDLGMSIKREPVCIEYNYNGNVHKYYPGFEIDGKLVEVKGDLFFDATGKMICPWDASKNDIYNYKYQVALQRGVEFWKMDKIKPILDYIDSKYTSDFLKLFEYNIPFPYASKLKNSGDMELIRFFHKSLYHASKKGKLSPYQAWQDKELVEKSALNRLQYTGNCSPESVVKGFSVAQIAPRVSVFKPNTAEYLIKKYLNDFSEIFDPFSGFSGRMLGAANCQKRYIGQDINEDHVKESNEIIQYKNLQNCSVKVQDIISDSNGTYECLLTCPPYGGKEHWNINNDEVEKSCDEWIDLCLAKYSCKKYLFVVDETEKYKDKIVETISSKTLYGPREEFVILI